MTPAQKQGLAKWHGRRGCQSRAHCDACKTDPVWRAKAIPGWDAAVAPPCPRPGLGDLVALVLRITGIKALWKWLNTRPCGCAARQSKLNRLKFFRFKLTW